ncbi:MAG: hypothetical protein QM727_10690 [Niabella sp.]
MKRITIAAFLILGSVGFASAQVSVNINIGQQPVWGPSGYNYAAYYYLPEMNCYYDVNRAMFIYPSGRRWVHARSLPRHYGHVDLYRTYKVVINDRNPYRYNRSHVTTYGRYANMHNQVIIRDNRDRYYNDRRDGYRHHDRRMDNRRNRGHYRY